MTPEERDQFRTMISDLLDEKLNGPLEQRIRRMVAEVMDEKLETKLQERFGEVEEHSREHMFLRDLMNWANSISNAFIRSLVQTLVAILVGLIVLGFVFWGRKHF